MSGGAQKLPVVLMTAIGGGYGDAAQHSQCLYATFAHMPGLKVVVPSNAYDAKGLMTQAIRDDNPVMFFFHKGLMGLPWMQHQEGATVPVPEEAYTLPFGQAAVLREGRHLTVVTLGQMVHKALAAARTLQSQGIDAEVIDLRTLVPLDTTAVLASVAKTGRLLVVDGLPAVRPERRDRRLRRGTPGPGGPEGAGAAARGARRPDPLQPAAGRGGDPFRGPDRGRLPRAHRRPPEERRMTLDVILPETAWEGVDGDVQGLVDAWLAAEGAAVEAGQPLVRVVLVKSSLEVEATASGRLQEILVPAGENFGRGQPLGRIATQ